MRQVYLIGLNIKKNKSRVEIMFKRDIKEVLDDIRYSEELLSMEELSDAMKDYIKYTDELIVSLQAYIDYLLIDEDSIDGDDIKP
jgi:hypothetical protein